MAAQKRVVVGRGERGERAERAKRAKREEKSGDLVVVSGRRRDQRDVSDTSGPETSDLENRAPDTLRSDTSDPTAGPSTGLDPRLVRGGGIAVAVLLVVAVIAAVVSGGGGDDADLDAAGADRSTSTTTTTGEESVDAAEQPATDADPAPADPTLDEGDRSSSPAPAPSGGDTAPAPADDEPAPAAGQNAGLGTEPGRYVYDQTGSYTSPFGSDDLPPEAAVTVFPSTADNRQQYRGEGDQGSGDLDVLHRPDRVELVSISGVQGSIPLEPPAEVIRLNATPGTNWNWERTTDFGPVAGDFTVTAVEDQDVGGQTVEVMVIDFRIEGEAEFDGTTYVYVAEGTWRVSGAHRMIVADDTELTVKQKPVAGPAVGPALIESSSSRTLRSLTPA